MLVVLLLFVDFILVMVTVITVFMAICGVVSVSTPIVLGITSLLILFIVLAVEGRHSLIYDDPEDEV